MRRPRRCCRDSALASSVVVRFAAMHRAPPAPPARLRAAWSLDQDACYRAVKGRDRRFDGVFYTAVRTTGIYCRPSCPAITPKRRNVSFFRTAAGGAGRRLPRLPPLPARRHPGLAGVGRRGRRRLAGDAAGRRRRGRARGRRRPGRRARLLDPPAQPRRHPAVRRRPARPGPVAARADRAGADRDHRPDLRRRRVRGRLRAASGSSTTPCARCTPPRRPTCATTARPPASRADVRHDPHPRRRTRAVRRRRRCTSSSRVHAVAGRRGLRTGLVRALAAACRTAPASSGSSSSDRPPGQVACTFTLADARDLAPATERTRRLLDADCDPVAVDEALAEDPVLAPLVAEPARAARARPPRRRRGRRPDRARPAGQPRRGPHRRGPARRRARRAARARRRPRGHPAVPDRRRRSPRSTPRRCRCRAPAAARWSALAAALDARRRTPRPQRRPRRDPCRPAGAARASARGPPTTSRCARWATPTCSCRPTSASATPPRALGLDDVGRPQRDLAAVALLRADAAVVGGARRHAPPPDPRRRASNPTATTDERSPTVTTTTWRRRACGP